MKAKMMYAFGLLSVFVLFACSDEENEPSIVAVESISISPSSISLERDKTYQLQAEVTPKEATEKKVLWSSSDTQVATVSENGLVTGVNKGTAVITVTAGGKSATCEETVTWEVQSVMVSPATLIMTKVGETSQLMATVLPEGAGEVVWSSSNEAVITVSPEGLVTAVGEGSAIITATAGGKSVTCEVAVEISYVTIDGNKATVQLDGATTEEMAKAVKEAAEAGVTEFILYGDYTAIGYYSSNIFNGIETELIDFSKVTGWPVDEDGLAKLPDNLFYNYKNVDFSGIKEVILPNEIQSIGLRAFYSCKNLRRIEAPGIRKLANQVFQSCTQLAEVNMPELIEIGRSCFSSSALTKVNFPKVTMVGGFALSMCRQLTEGSLPKVKTIGVIEPEGVTSQIDAKVFGDCSKLEKVYLPEVITLGDMAFNGCKALKEIELPEVTEIGLTALMNCSALVSARLPKATYFDRDVFTNCEALSRLYLLAEGGISVKSTTFGPADHVTKNIDLTLHPNKESEVKDPFVGEGKEWKGHNWKSISFAEN